MNNKLIASTMSIFTKLVDEDKAKVADIVCENKNATAEQIHSQLEGYDHRSLKKLLLQIKEMFKERKLSGSEKRDREHNVKKLKKHHLAKDLAYAIATRDAKRGKRYK